MQPAKQRRKHIRKPTALDILVTSSSEDVEYVKARTRNLSLCGMAIEWPGNRLQENQIVSLYFATQPHDFSTQRTIRARVIHANSEVVGLQFEVVGVKVLSVIHELLSDAKYF